MQANTTIHHKLIDHIQPYLDADILSGLSLGVISGEDQTTIHLGKSSYGGNRPNDHTIYEIGSLTKVFTGILLADAVVKGDLRLNQPAQKWLPDDVKMPKNGKPIQLIDLATHTSGLPRLADNGPTDDPNNPYAGYSSKLAFEFLNSHTLRFPPGIKYEYSNFGTSLLGLFLSKDAGVDYETLLLQRITEPLKMTSTVVNLPPRLEPHTATPYASADSEISLWDFADMPGAGGIRSTISDLMKFAKANLKPMNYATAQSIELAWRQHYKNEEAAMGLGWHIPRNGVTRWHSGLTGGFHSMMYINREKQLAVVQLTNTATPQAGRLVKDIFKTVLGTDVEPRQFPKPVAVDKDIMLRYIGRYKLAPDSNYTVFVENEMLMVELTGQRAYRVYPLSEETWFYKVVTAEITFKTENNVCTGLEIFQNDRRQHARRIEMENKPF